MLLSATSAGCSDPSTSADATTALRARAYVEPPTRLHQPEIAGHHKSIGQTEPSRPSRRPWRCKNRPATRNRRPMSEPRLAPRTSTSAPSPSALLRAEGAHRAPPGASRRSSLRPPLARRPDVASTRAAAAPTAVALPVADRRGHAAGLGARNRARVQLARLRGEYRSPRPIEGFVFALEPRAGIDAVRLARAGPERTTGSSPFRSSARPAVA